MATFQEHIEQVKHNLRVLEKINECVPNSWDWQVTVSFYCSVHLVNAHLAKFSLQYRTHEDVKHALNPKVQLSVSKIPDEQYIAYMSLVKLSRRSRYLVKANDITAPNASKAYEIHFSKTLRHLENLLTFFSDKYGVVFTPISVRCQNIKQDELNHFNKILFPFSQPQK